MRQIEIARGARILFQGDSITDSGRNRADTGSLGSGYAMMAAAQFLLQHPRSDVEFLNRGISGDRTADLLARWEHDCTTLRPNVVSLLIGINNVWRRYDRQDPTPLEQFAQELDQLLLTTRTQTNAQILLLEPFLLPINDDVQRMREDLDPKIQAVRYMARKYDAALVALDGLFAEASAARQADYWARDGVHPTLAGHALIARAWLQTVRYTDHYHDEVANPGPGRPLPPA